MGLELYTLVTIDRRKRFRLRARNNRRRKYTSASFYEKVCKIIDNEWAISVGSDALLLEWHQLFRISLIRTWKNIRKKRRRESEKTWLPGALGDSGSSLTENIIGTKVPAAKARKRARRASNASNGAFLITIILLVCRYPRTIGEPFLPFVLNSPMRVPSATLSPLRCAILRTILFVFWFFGAERTEKRVSPVQHNRSCSESSPLSSISHASLAPYPPKNGRSSYSEIGEHYPLLRSSRMQMCLPFAWEVIL